MSTLSKGPRYLSGGTEPGMGASGASFMGFIHFACSFCLSSSINAQQKLLKFKLIQTETDQNVLSPESQMPVEGTHRPSVSLGAHLSTEEEQRCIWASGLQPRGRGWEGRLVPGKGKLPCRFTGVSLQPLGWLDRKPMWR